MKRIFASRHERNDFFLFSIAFVAIHVWNVFMSLSVECKLKTWKNDERKKERNQIWGSTTTALSQICLGLRKITLTTTTNSTDSKVKLFFFFISLYCLCSVLFPSLVAHLKKKWKTKKIKEKCNSKAPIARAFLSFHGKCLQSRLR